MQILRFLLSSGALLLAACNQKVPAEFIWYEEAKQDDGTIVLIKKIESTYGVSRKEPGAQNYGYRLPRVELSDPKTGQPIRWYPRNLPHLLPYALHVQEGVPYMFATFYLSNDYRAFGCPIPPYIVFRWDVDKWRRIPMTALPMQFKRRNLLDGAAAQIHVDPGGNPGWTFIKSGDIVKPESIEIYVRSITGRAKEGNPPHIYDREIQYDDIGPYDECNGIKNESTQYDNVEIK